jgi:hypothetical protein
MATHLETRERKEIETKTSNKCFGPRSAKAAKRFVSIGARNEFYVNNLLGFYFWEGIKESTGKEPEEYFFTERERERERKMGRLCFK